MQRRSPSRRKNPPPHSPFHCDARNKLTSASTTVSSRVLVPRQDILASNLSRADLLAGSDRTHHCGHTHCGCSPTSSTTTTLKPLTSTSTKTRICSLAGAACLAAWWLELVDSRLALPLVCGFAGGCCYALFANSSKSYDRVATLENGLDDPEPEPEMWTITQFETLGALRFDNYVRFLVTKLAVVWRAIAALHKTATNYRFSLSISDKPSLQELQDVLEGRVPLMLTYDDIKPEHDESAQIVGRSRGSSIASTAVTDDLWYRESMDLAGMDLEVTRGSFLDNEITPECSIPAPPVSSNEFMALEDQDQVTEYFTIEDEGTWSETESDRLCTSFIDEEDTLSTPISSPKIQPTPAPTSAKLAVLRSIPVPVQPLEDLVRELNTQVHVVPAPKNLEPLVVPAVKPMIEKTNQVAWKDAATRPEAAALLARDKTPQPKRRISVNVTSMKPLPRLVVKARPSTRTPPQNVQHMLDQVERMMREVHDLLAVGRDVLRSVETPEEKAPRKCKKAVSFDDDVRVIDSALGMAPEEELELRSSLSYGPDEIELMSNAFFGDLTLPADE